MTLEGDADIDAASGGGLESALVELDRTTEALVEDASRHGGRLGFSADRLPPATPQHATVEGFRTAVATALDAIVDAAAQLAGAIVRVAGSLPADEVVGAAGTIGAQLAKPVSGLRRLLSIGLEKLRSAVNTLMKVLGEQRAAALRGWIAEQWEKLRSGQLLAGPIGVLLGTGATRQLADGIVAGPELTAERIDGASVRVASVTAQYGRTASQLEGHAGVLASAAKWGFAASKLLPVLGPWVTGAALAGYMALLGIGLLLAMDVADAEIDLGHVVGRARHRDRTAGMTAIGGEAVWRLRRDNERRTLTSSLRMAEAIEEVAATAGVDGPAVTAAANDVRGDVIEQRARIDALSQEALGSLAWMELRNEARQSTRVQTHHVSLLQGALLRHVGAVRDHARRRARGVPARAPRQRAGVGDGVGQTRRPPGQAT